CIFDVSEPPLAQDIKFVQTYSVCFEHIHMRRHKAFGWQFGDYILVQGFFANQHTARMYRDIGRKINEQFAEFLYPALKFIFRIPCLGMGQAAYLFFGKAKDLSPSTNNSPSLKGRIHPQSGYILSSIAHKYTFKEGIAI